MKKMKIAIITAMQIEIDDILKATGKGGEETIFGRTVYFSSYKGHDLYLGVAGIGKANAASFCQLLLDRYDADVVFNSGIAGSLEDHVGLMSLVLGTTLHYHDFPVSILEETYPYKPHFEADPELLKLAGEAVPADIRCVKGPIATGDDFINSPEKRERVKAATGAVACDMESCAIAQVANGAGKPCLILRAISDGADEGLEGTYERFKHRAAAAAAETVLHVIEALG